jgi:hypothetical protein
MPAPRLPPSLGLPVTTRQFSLLEMVSRAWGSEFQAPDHGVYRFNNGARWFDSTDQGTTGIYRRGYLSWTADEQFITADERVYDADGHWPV